MDVMTHESLAGLLDELLDALGAEADAQLVADGNDRAPPQAWLCGQQLDQGFVVGELLAEVQLARLGAA